MQENPRDVTYFGTKVAVTKLYYGRHVLEEN